MDLDKGCPKLVLIQSYRWALRGLSLKRVLSTKTLGVVVDECITWKDHIDKVAKKAAKGIGILRRSKHLFDKDTLKTIYSAFVLPHFDYCSLVWNNCSKTLQNKLQKLQNIDGRIITGDCYETASENVRTKLSWDTLEARREKQLETLMIQIRGGPLEIPGGGGV